MSAAARAAPEIAPADLEATVRAFEFLDSVQRHSQITVAVVYRTGDAESKAQAQRAAAILATLKGQSGAVISATVVAANELAQLPHRVDALYLVPNIGESGKLIGDYARRQHVLPISSDPACFGAQCCAMMVRGGTKTEIVLDTAMARETGASFSTVFMMLVKRR